VPGARLTLPGGLTAWAEPEELLAGRPLPSPREAPIVAPGTTRLPDWGIEVRTEVVPPPASPRTGAWEALLDGGVAADALAVRSRRPGDRYRPLGAPGERKLQDVLVDGKVPRASRDRVPLLTAGGRLVWVAGHRIAHDFRITASSASALRVQILPLATDLPLPAELPRSAGNLSTDRGAP
jgi:tRNA(Ile)-lysidine synthase